MSGRARDFGNSLLPQPREREVIANNRDRDRNDIKSSREKNLAN